MSPWKAAIQTLTVRWAGHGATADVPCVKVAAKHCHHPATGEPALRRWLASLVHDVAYGGHTCSLVTAQAGKDHQIWATTATTATCTPAVGSQYADR